MAKIILREIVEAGIIDKSIAARIEAFYKTKEKSGAGRMVIVFGILGGLLVGMGILLILAHNWDKLSKVARLALALLPLLITQGFVLYRIFARRPMATAIRETLAALMIFSVGTSIALVSQIYNINGQFSDFILVWVLSSIPVIYVLESSVASLLVWIGAACYACSKGYFGDHDPVYLYPVLLLSILPHYLSLMRNSWLSNFTTFHHYVITFSVLIAFGTLSPQMENWVPLAYMSLLGCFILIGQQDAWTGVSIVRNAYLVAGYLGTVFLLLTTTLVSTRWFVLERSEGGLAALIILVAFIIFIVTLRKGKEKVNFFSIVFLIYAILFVTGSYAAELIKGMMSLLILALGISTVWRGGKGNHLGLLNFGLLILTALIVVRFFDSNISFVLRGILFILVGSGFFAGNYWLIRKRKGA